MGFSSGSVYCIAENIMKPSVMLVAPIVRHNSRFVHFLRRIRGHGEQQRSMRKKPDLPRCLGPMMKLPMEGSEVITSGVLGDAF